MRRISMLVLGVVAATTAGVGVTAFPAAAASSVTLDASTCAINGPDVTINGSWSALTSTCAVTGFAAVQPGSTLTIPSGTTLTDASATYAFNNGGSVVNDGTVDACYWDDFGKGITTNAATGTFAISRLGSCRSSEHEIYVGGQFQNSGAYSDSGSLVIDGYLGGATFTNLCGSSYSETGTVVTVQGGVLTFPSACPQTITFSGPTTGSVGGSYTATASASSGLPVSFSLDTSSTGCSLSVALVTFTGAGTCVVDASQAGSSTYAPAPTVSVSSTISLVPQTITFSGPTTGSVGGSYTATANASSGLAVSFSLDTSSTGCSLSVALVTFTGAGTCVVDASQAGSSTYAPAPTVSVSSTVSVVTQTITFMALANQIYGSAPFTVSAAATSGLPVGFASLTPGVCGVSGTTVSLLSTGLCTIEATQPGNASWPAATPVDQSFSVLALVKVYLPPNFSIWRGEPLLFGFSLDDVNNRPIPDAIADGATMVVSFNGGPPFHAVYVPWLREFAVLLPTPRHLAPGTYPLTITSLSPSVPIVPTTVSVGVTRQQGRRS